MSTFKMMFSFLVTCILYVMDLNYILFLGLQPLENLLDWAQLLAYS